MKPSSLLFWLIPPALGLFAGWQLKKPGPEVESHAEPGESSPQIHAIPRSDQHSSSSAQSSTVSGAFTSLPLGDSYQEWFLFLSGVSAEDFPGLYQEFQERPTRSRDLTRLFFLHWTRIDPGSAIEAARQAGDSDLRTAYHMWACHDPGTALATALAKNDPAYQVAWGIGEFHPAWLEENWDQLPESLRLNAVSGAGFWPNPEDPGARIRLARKAGINYSRYDEKDLLAMAREDCLEAYRTVKSLSGGSINASEHRHLNTLFSALAKNEPALLEVIAKQCKSPIERNQIQRAQFNSTLIENPGAAKAMLDRLPESWLKEDLTINYAKHLLATDPDTGFPTAVETLKTQSKKRPRMIGVEHHSGGGASSTRQADTETLMQQLIDHDANALMDDLLPSPEEQDHSKLFEEAGREWAETNFEAYRDWVDEHPANPAVYKTGILNVLNHLRNAGHHREGMAWISKLPVSPDQREITASQHYRQWIARDPEGALAWRHSPDFQGDPERFPESPPDTRK